MRKTIAGLEEELRLMKQDRDQLLEDKEHLRESMKNLQAKCNHFQNLTDRLLNILEWNAKEGKGYGK